MFTENDIHRLGWDEDYKQFNRDFDALKKRIAKRQGCERDLRTLAKAGADRDLTLEFLTHVVWDLERSWQAVMKEKQAAFTAAVRQLGRAIEAIEKVANDPLCRGELWLLVLNPSVSAEDVNAATRNKKQFDARVVDMLRLMRGYQAWARGMTKAFGQQMRKQKELARNREIGRLLNYIRHKTANNHYDELARLLTDAYETVGSTKYFSADQLKQLRYRHIVKPSLTPAVPVPGPLDGKTPRFSFVRALARPW